VSESVSPAKDEAPTSSASSTLESVLALLVNRPHLADEVAKLRSERDEYRLERDEYKMQYLTLLEAYRKLEMGIVGQKRERFISAGEQETFDAVLEALKPTSPDAAPATEGEGSRVEAHTRAKPKPTGKQPLPENLPRVEVRVLPPEVERLGLDAFTQIGEDVKETIEKRAASFIVVRTVRPKFVPKVANPDEKPVMQADAVPPPIAKASVGPTALAESVVLRWGMYLPLYRLERLYEQQGFAVARSTVCGWHFAAHEVMLALVDAMRIDALSFSPVLCTDATNVKVQALNECRTAHFFTVVAPGRCVLFQYSKKHNKLAVDELFEGYTGILVRDAHSIYLHFDDEGDITGAGCWSHVRRYIYKAFSTDPARSAWALTCVQKLFAIERALAKVTPEVRLAQRQALSKPLVDEFLAWCDAEALKVIDSTPISKAINYARNNRDSLMVFLTNGEVPIDNNVSERELRRQALGRKNFMFLGTDEGGAVNATFTSLLASCEMHKVPPLAYLRDVFCLMSAWQASGADLLELAPANWAVTSQRPDVIALLEANHFRRAGLG
jgi:transposase